MVMIDNIPKEVIAKYLEEALEMPTTSLRDFLPEKPEFCRKVDMSSEPSTYQDEWSLAQYDRSTGHARFAKWSNALPHNDDVSIQVWEDTFDRYDAEKTHYLDQNGHFQAARDAIYAVGVRYYPAYNGYWTYVTAQGKGQRLDLWCVAKPLPLEWPVDKRSRMLAASIYVAMREHHERRISAARTKGNFFVHWELDALRWWAYKAAEVICDDQFFRGGQG